MNGKLEIKRATRQGVRPLIGLYSESGCGKTYSALLLARGFVGPEGKMCIVDSERGRGSLYADVLPEGYDALAIEEPFSPQRYIDAIEAVEVAGYSIGVIDSASHEWEGLGGVCNMADENEERSGKPGLHNWNGPKREHLKFLLRLLRSSIPWIVCIRAKYKTKQRKDDRGKTVIIKDDYASPIQAEDFVFELTFHGQIMPDHSLHISKSSHPSLRACFPEDKPIEIRHGALLAAWCNGSTTQKPSAPAPEKPKADAQPKAPTEATRVWMFEKLKGIEPERIQAYAIDAAIIMPNETLDDWPLHKVPTSKEAMDALRIKIVSHV